jgi:hypothetical protein
MQLRVAPRTHGEKAIAKVRRTQPAAPTLLARADEVIE